MGWRGGSSAGGPWALCSMVRGPCMLAATAATDAQTVAGWLSYVSKCGSARVWMSCGEYLYAWGSAAPGPCCLLGAMGR